MQLLHGINLSFFLPVGGDNDQLPDFRCADNSIHSVNDFLCIFTRCPEEEEEARICSCELILRGSGQYMPKCQSAYVYMYNVICEVLYFLYHIVASY